jgi:hypothetical protein
MRSLDAGIPSTHYGRHQFDTRYENFDVLGTGPPAARTNAANMRKAHAGLQPL